MRARIILLVASLFVLGCEGLPPFPKVEIKLVDAKNDKIHLYNLPQKRGDKAPYLGSTPASIPALNKNYCLAPSEYSKLEQYISAVEDVAERRCK